jgi:uncharacterized membrane protein YagU involved in acid resistance
LKKASNIYERFWFLFQTRLGDIISIEHWITSFILALAAIYLLKDWKQIYLSNGFHYRA